MVCYKFFNSAYNSINLQKQKLKVMENIEETSTNVRKKTTILSNGIQYGLYAGIGSVLLSLLFYALDVSRESYIQWLSYVILIAAIVLATINYRDKINGGLISYGDAFLTGLFVALTSAVITVIYSYIFIKYIDPNFTKEMLDAVEQKLADKGLSDEMIDQQVAMAGKFMKPGLMMITGFITIAVMGVILSLITAAILKKTDDSFNATFNQ